MLSCWVEVNCLSYCFKQLEWQLIPSKNSVLALLIWPNAEYQESTDAIWLTSVWSIIMFHDFVSRLSFWFDYYINESNKRFQELSFEAKQTRCRVLGRQARIDIEIYSTSGGIYFFEIFLRSTIYTHPKRKIITIIMDLGRCFWIGAHLSDISPIFGIAEH